MEGEDKVLRILFLPKRMKVQEMENYIMGS